MKGGGHRKIERDNDTHVSVIVIVLITSSFMLQICGGLFSQDADLHPSDKHQDILVFFICRITVTQEFQMDKARDVSG